MVRRITVVVGRDGAKEQHIKAPMTTAELTVVIADVSEHLLEPLLMKELILTLGNLVRTQPEVFDGLRTIRLNHLLLLCAETNDELNFDSLADLSNLAYQLSCPLLFIKYTHCFRSHSVIPFSFELL